MIIANLIKRFGITRTSLDKACLANSVFPIRHFSDYYISRKTEKIYTLTTDGRNITFVPLITKKVNKYGFPVHNLKNDITEKYENISLDKLYLYTFYGVLPDEMIHYGKYYQYKVGDLSTLTYKIFKIHKEDRSTYYIHGIEFRKCSSALRSKIFVSENGVGYDEITNEIILQTYDGKYYPSIRGQKLHQCVFRAWNYNDEELPEDLVIDHIDGFKNHSWASNLQLVSQLENYRNSAYLQGLRTTPWTIEIIEFICQQMEDPTVSGPLDIKERVEAKFPYFGVSYGAFKHKIYEIKNREFWTDISSKYNIDVYEENFNKHAKYPTEDDQIRAICEFAIKNSNENIQMTNKQIAQELGIGWTIVNRVLRGDYRTDISSEYNLEYNNKKRRAFTSQEVNSICTDVMKGLSNGQISKKYGRSMADIKKIIRREVYPEIGRNYHFELVRHKANYRVPYKGKNKKVISGSP